MADRAEPDAPQGPADNPRVTGDHAVMPDAFISYASHDADVATALVAELEKHGVVCWIAPRDVRAGALYADAIVRAISGARAFVLVLSGNSIDSSHVSKEIERASSKKRPIIALRIDAAPLSPALEYFLSESQWVEAQAGNMQAAYAKLIDAIRDLAPAEVGAAPAVHRAATPGGARSGQPKSRLTQMLITAGIVVGCLVLGKVWLSKRPEAQPSGIALTPAAAPVAPAPPATPAISEKSVAVLPFVDMSEKKDQEYFSDGLSEELIDLLAQTPDLQVIARTSSFYFKGKQVTIAEIARTLGVANVLEGSVRKSGTTLRVTAQLIRADTGVHLWSKTYDRQERDIFKVQDELAAAVVEALRAKLLPGTPVMSAHRTDSSEAYDQYLLGKQAYNRDEYAKAVSAYQRAVNLDANFGAAYAGLAEAEADLADNITGERAALNRALAAADRAVGLAPNQPYGYAARGWLRFTFFWDWKGGRADIEKAMAYDAGNSIVQIRYSELLAGLGHLPEAVMAAKKAVDADPLSANSWKVLGKWLTHDRQFQAAHQALSRASELNPEMFYPQWYLARLEVLDGHANEALGRVQFLSSRLPDGGLFINSLATYTLGRKAESQRELDDVVARYAATLAFQIVEAFAWRGETGKAFEWLDRSYAQHDSGLLWIKTDPFLDSIRADARYTAMLRKMNLPE